MDSTSKARNIQCNTHFTKGTQADNDSEGDKSTWEVKLVEMGELIWELNTHPLGHDQVNSRPNWTELEMMICQWATF